MARKFKIPSRKLRPLRKKRELWIRKLPKQQQERKVNLFNMFFNSNTKNLQTRWRVKERKRLLKISNALKS